MSVFGESIQFLAKLGIYDVVLPFLLVFTIVFSLMEKTKVLGTEKNIFMVIVFVSIIAIFLNALGWLDVIYNYLKDNWNTSYVATVILIIAIIGFMAWIMHDPSDSKDAKKEGTG